MPRLLDTGSRTDAIGTAIARLVVREGLGAVTLRGIAAEVGLSPGTLTAHYRTRERLIRVTGMRFAREFAGATGDRSWGEGLDAFLPEDDDQVWWTRCWLAWAELARSEPDLGHACADGDLAETYHLARVLDRRDRDDPVPRLVHATVVGLRHAICRTDRPLPLPEARALLAATARAALTLPEPPPPPPPAAG